MNHFNGLLPAEAERLALLAEESAELIQIIGKILRHGYESYNPDDTYAGSNREQLEAEIGDVVFSIELMQLSDDIDKRNVDIGREIASEKKPKYLHHQPLLAAIATDDKGQDYG